MFKLDEKKQKNTINKTLKIFRYLANSTIFISLVWSLTALLLLSVGIELYLTISSQTDGNMEFKIAMFIFLFLQFKRMFKNEVFDIPSGINMEIIANIAIDVIISILLSIIGIWAWSY